MQKLYSENVRKSLGRTYIYILYIYVYKIFYLSYATDITEKTPSDVNSHWNSTSFNLFLKVSLRE